MNACLIGSMRNQERMLDLARELREHGHKVTTPVDASEATFADRAKEKAQFIRGMFETIQGCDDVLAVNDMEHAGYKGYIGPNTFLQLGMGFALGKTLFCLEPWDERLPYNEELKAMGINRLDLKMHY